jgi:integrase
MKAEGISKMALTTKKVAKLKEPGRYLDRRGLYLQITPAGVRSWVLRYERGGRERMMGLGPLDDFTLEMARERASAARRLLKDNIDPLDARNQERAKQVAEAAKAEAETVTFKECAEEYFKFHSPKWSSAKHAKQFTSTLEQYAYPVLRNVPVAAIDKTLVLKAITPHWYRVPETVDRVRGRIAAILDYAKTHGYRGEGDNPAAWTANLKHALPARKEITGEPGHHAALEFAEVPAFVVQLQARDRIAARALEFLILTAARLGEVIGAKWDEIDLVKKTWTIPPERMKARRQHTVPLCGRAIEILKALPREGEGGFVFIGGRKNTALSDLALGVVLKAIAPGATVHGFRSSFRDWVAEKTAYPNIVAEMALAHKIGDQVEAAYRRGNLLTKRTRLMADWATYCTTPQLPQRGATVTPIRARV